MTFGSDNPAQCNPQLTLKLPEELQFAKFLMNHITDAVFWFDSEAQFCYVNDVACRWLEYSREELLSLTVYDVDRGFSAETWLQCRRSLQQQKTLTFGSRYQTKKGKTFPVDVTLLYLEYYGKEFNCALIRKKSAESKLRQALKQAKKHSQQRARFIYMLTHEVCTPLNIVSFSTSLLKRHSHQLLQAKQLQYFDRIQTAVDQINELLDEVLLISQAEAGKLKFEPKPLNLTQFCNDLVAQIQLLSSSNQHVIAFVNCGNYSTACVDKKLLQSILTNLLNNAIKYSAPGSKIDLKLMCRNENLIFQIQDAGIGIPVADQQQLFEPFYRGSNVGDVPGTGVGLTIVKKLLDLHKGKITLVSEVGKGTTFTITLPLLND